MSQKKNVVISDIHMGINVPTNWYQKDIHEPYLVHILKWVIENKSDVDELIILGDLFDFWTYPPDVKPPSASEIISKNPNILGPTGYINQVLVALDGRVSYLRGNHDITTTQEDLNGIGSGQYKVKMRSDIYVKDDVVYTHGHLYTMFNAPDISSSPPHPLPVGHFVTRAISYMLQQKGESAAKEPGFGAANMGYGGLKGILKDGYKGIVDRSVTDVLLNTVQNATEISDDTEIILEQNFGSITYGEVKKIYANLFTDWVNRYNHGVELDIRGALYAYKAAYADYNGSYLGWFAQRLAFEHCAGLVVMGHTHIPKQGLYGDIADYINTGFECVSTPDMNVDKMTFGVVSVENGAVVSSEVVAVTKDGNGTFQNSNDHPPKAMVQGGDGSDFGCYITVENKSGEDYKLDPKSIKDTHGYYVVYPPAKIPNNSTVKFWISDVPNTPVGSQGSVTYVGADSGQKVPLTFRCTTIEVPGTHVNPNQCNGTNEFYTKSGSVKNDWSAKNHIQRDGHPFFAKFILHKNNGNSFVKKGNSLVAVDGTCLKPGEYVTVNGSTDLSNVLTDSHDAKVFSILMKADPSGLESKIYSYELEINGKGPHSYWHPTLSLFVKPVDQSGEAYSKSLFSSSRETHKLYYGSDAPNIVKITWDEGTIS